MSTPSHIEQRDDGTWGVFDATAGVLRPGRFLDRETAERAARACDCECDGCRQKTTTSEETSR